MAFSWAQVPSRWGLLGSSVHTCVCTRSERRFNLGVWLAICSFVMGSPFQGRVFIPVYVLDRNEGFCLGLSAFLFLRDGVTLSGSCAIPGYVHDRNEGFSGFYLAGCSFAMFPFIGSGFIVLGRAFAFLCLRPFAGTFSCWMLRPCLVCLLAFDCGQSASGSFCCCTLGSRCLVCLMACANGKSTSGLFCCYALSSSLPDLSLGFDSGRSAAGLFCCCALSSSFVDYSPLVVYPSGCLALGSINHFSVVGPPASSSSTEFLRVLFFHVAQSLCDVIIPSGFEYASVLDRNEGFSVNLFWLGGFAVFAMRSPFSGSGLFSASVLDRNEDDPTFGCDWFRAFAIGSPFSGSSVRMGLPHSIGTKAPPVSLLYSFGMRSLLGQVCL